MIGLALSGLSLIPGFGKLQAGTQKLLAFALIVVVLGGAFGVVYKVIYSAGKHAGREEMSKEIVKQKEAEWKTKEQEIEAYKVRSMLEIEEKRSQVDAQINRLARLPGETRAALTADLQRLNQERDRRYEDVNAVPASELWGRIRAKSDELARTTQRGGATPSTPAVD